MITDAESDCFIHLLLEDSESESDSEMDDDVETDVFIEKSHINQIVNSANHLKFDGPFGLTGCFCSDIFIPPPDSCISRITAA